MPSSTRNGSSSEQAALARAVVRAGAQRRFRPVPIAGPALRAPRLQRRLALLADEQLQVGAGAQCSVACANAGRAAGVEHGCDRGEAVVERRGCA